MYVCSDGLAGTGENLLITTDGFVREQTMGCSRVDRFSRVEL